MSRSSVLAAALVSVAALIVGVPSTAAPSRSPVSGAIFTTDATGVPVNLNHYASKLDVYLNGGPGLNAPDDAAGLPDGVYSFQVTDPSGKTLLSEDDVSCRQFTVTGGVIQSVAPGGACAHVTGADGEDGGVTVQLFPYADTPNNGGVYKVWVTPTASLDCSGRGNRHCFVPAQSKTDNYKVRPDAIVEIDARFWKDGVALLGMAARWTDTNGASNVKFSEYAPELLAFREAHIEAVEPGRHVVTVADQPGCAIAAVEGSLGEAIKKKGGVYRAEVDVAPWQAGDDITYRVEVTCR